MEISEKSEIEEVSIWDNYKAPEKIEEPQQYYQGLTKEKVENAINEVFKGRGIYQQIQQGNIHNYNSLTAEDLREAFSGLFNKK